MTAFESLAVEPIIGLEIHVQLTTRTKLWCSRRQLSHGVASDLRDARVR